MDSAQEEARRVSLPKASGEQVAAAHQPAAEPEAGVGSHGLPWRAIVVGALLLPPLTFFGHRSFIIAQSAVWTAQTLLRGPVVLLFLLVLWSLLWKRVSPALGRRLSLTPRELILIYVMLTVGTALAGECWSLHVVPGLAGTAAYGARTANGAWGGWLKETPTWFVVQDPDVVLAVHGGQSSLYLPRNLRALAVPVAAWSVLMLALAFFTQCLAQIVRRQWVQRERLSFPLVYLPLTLVATDGPQAWFRNRLFWGGMAVAAAVELINGFQYLYPSIPYLPVKVTQFPPWPDRPWSGLGSIWVAFYPWVIALGFMVPAEVSFSLWFFFWLSRIQDMAAVEMGLRSAGGYAVGLPPFHIHQETGAFLVLGALLLWRSRRELTGAWGRAWGPEQRKTTLGLVLSAGVVLGWAAAARIPLWMAGAFLAIYGLFSIVLGRLAAECGGPSAYPPLSIHETMGLMVNVEQMPRPQVVAFGWWQNLGTAVTDDLLPHQITGARLAEDTGARRGLHVLLAVGAVAGILVGIWSLLDLYFHYGIMSAKVRAWPARTAPQSTFRFIHHWLNDPLRVPPEQLGAFLAGGAIAGALVFLRERFVGWPLHPIGYAVAGNWGMQEVWCPFFVAWLIKSLTLHSGGVRLYRALLPFFLGLLMGDFLVPMGWAVAGLVTGQQMYLAFPH
jgi:hypothetical protein